ncbi:MAG: DUF3299 domain-containing protein [Idiomarina sp.]|nr:DUF3299 domain-containing protein [Idiomarina sp.]
MFHSLCRSMAIAVFAVTLLAVSLHAFSKEAQVELPLTIEWVDLMPAHILESIESMPMLEHDYSEDAVDPFSDEWEDPYAELWNEILSSTEVVDKYAGKLIRLPGFIVPLDVDDQNRVLSFFLVPYFGACIHVPPPPPNQLIYVENSDLAKKIDVHNMYTPFWLTGYLEIEQTQHELGLAAYTIKMTNLNEYRWE